MASKCSQCPIPGENYERFRFLVTEFDVIAARELIAKSPRESLEISYEQLRSLGLGLDPEGDWKVREDGTRYKTLHMGTYVSEDHLAHIPAEKLDEPVLIIPFRSYSRKDKNDIKCHIMIDGAHRATRLYREGKQVTAYMLTEKEAVACCTNREPHWWKGIKKVKAA